MDRKKTKIMDLTYEDIVNIGIDIVIGIEDRRNERFRKSQYQLRQRYAKEDREKEEQKKMKKGKKWPPFS